MTKDTGKARLPGLVAPRVEGADLARWVQAVQERLEVREGSRGNPYERAVTVRDLTEGGLAVLGGGGRLVSGGGGSSGGGGFGGSDYEQFWEELKNSSLYKGLMQRLDDPTRFDDLAEEVKAVLLRDIADEARLRGADIKRLEHKVQTETRSLAMAVQEVTAAVQDASAGVRSTQFAQATMGEAIAGQVTQLQARLEVPVADADKIPAVGSGPYASLADLRAAVPAGLPGKYYRVTNPAPDSDPVTNDVELLYVWHRGEYLQAGTANSARLEQVLKTTASAVDGLKSEYYVKVQAGGAFGGYGISAVSPVDPSKPAYSQFLVAADKFALISPDGQLNPFAVDTAKGIIYLNGKVYINANGDTLNDSKNALLLSATGQVFNVSSSNAISPASIVLTANLQGALAGAASFSTTPPGLGAPSGNTLTIPSSAMASNSTVKVKASLSKNGTTYSDEMTLYKVIDGADALVGFLTNESHAVPASNAGAVSSYAGASGEFVVFKGGQKLTSGVSFAIPVGGNPNNLSASINSAGSYAINGGLSVDTATLTLRATVGAANIDKVFTLARQKEGSTGDFTDYMFRRSISAPSAPTTANPAGWYDYPPAGADPLYMTQALKRANGVLAGAWSTPVRLDGQNGSNSKYQYRLSTSKDSADAGSTSWTDAVQTPTASRPYLWMRIGTVTPPSTTVDWGSPFRVSGEQGDSGKNGERGSVTAYATVGSAYWSDDAAVSAIRAIVGASEPMRIGDTVTLSNAALKYAETRYWGGTSWLKPGVTIDGNLLVKGTVSADKISAGAITADKIGSGLSASNVGYSFGFGTAGGVLSLSGAGFFKSDSANTYGLAAVHTAGNAAILGTATGTGGMAGLFGFGPINTPRYSATLAKDGLGGFFQYRNALADPSNDSHDSSSISTAKLATPVSAGVFRYMNIRTEICGYGGGAVQGIYTTGGAYIEGFVSVNQSLGANYDVASFYGNIRADRGNVYAGGKMLTFTGAHFAMTTRSVKMAIGDIAVDFQVIARSSVSDTITEVVLSSRASQKGVIGVYSGDDSSVPPSMASGAASATEPPKFDLKHAPLLKTHKVITVNSLGEGQINVCGEGGNLEIGDLIVASSMPGKGMKQSDDLVRSATVAKVREPVTFSSPDEVKMVACIYMCG